MERKTDFRLSVFERMHMIGIVSVTDHGTEMIGGEKLD